MTKKRLRWFTFSRDRKHYSKKGVIIVPAGTVVREISSYFNTFINIEIVYYKINKETFSGSSQFLELIDK